MLTLYAEQSADFWREKAVVAWLDVHARALATRLRAGGREAAALRACARARERAYPRGGRDVLLGSEFAELAEEARHGLIPAEAGAEALRLPAAGALDDDDDGGGGWELGGDDAVELLLANAHFGARAHRADGGSDAGDESADEDEANRTSDNALVPERVSAAYDTIEGAWDAFRSASTEYTEHVESSRGLDDAAVRTPAGAARRAGLVSFAVQLGEELLRTLLELDALDLAVFSDEDEHDGRVGGNGGGGDDDDGGGDDGNGGDDGGSGGGGGNRARERRAMGTIAEHASFAREWRRSVSHDIQRLLDQLDQWAEALRRLGA